MAGEGSPVIICQLRTLEGDGKISPRFFWRKSIPSKEHSRQIGENFSKPGCRNMFGHVCSRKNQGGQDMNSEAGEETQLARSEGLDLVGLKGFLSDLVGKALNMMNRLSSPFKKITMAPVGQINCGLGETSMESS